MENNFETIAFAMLGSTLSVLMSDLRGVGFKTERDSCAGTASAFTLDGTCVFRAIQTSRKGTWIVRARKGLVTVQTIVLDPCVEQD